MITNNSKAPSCTCPSGDGSLRHPCPAHPAQVEQAGDERVIGWRERILAAHPSSDPGFWPDALLVEHMAAEIADLRAALAQPSPVHELDPLGLAPHAEAFNEAPDEALRPEQAEAERPEVVAYRTIGRHTKHQHPHYALNYYKQNAEDQAAHWRERGCEVSEDELMTVAQHDRIVGELRAENAKLSEALDRWPLIRDSLKLRLADALARVAELELKLDKSDYAYDNDRIHMRGLAARAIARAKVFDDGSDGADAESARSVVAILRELLAVGPAQAQHSVPEGYALIPVRETEAMHDAVMALLYKGVARTDTQKLLDAYIAAAPGKEVGHE